MAISERWRKLTAKSEKVKINDELEITVTGLTFKEFGKMAGFMDKKDHAGALNYLLVLSLQKCPEFEDKEAIPEFVETISAEVGAQIVEAVQRLSGINEGKGKNDEGTS